MGTGMNHLETSVIIDLVEQRLSEAEAAACKAHLDTCSVCAETYQSWCQFNSTLAPEPLVDASEELIKRCISIFPGAPPESGFRQTIGQVVFDSLLRPTPALGIRGERDARQTVFHMDKIDVHIRITGTGSRQTIKGQILPRGDETAVNAACVTLLALGRTTRSTTSDHLGVFDFRDVPKAPTIITIKLQASRFVGVLSIGESNAGG
jgi:hypothetical protein